MIKLYALLVACLLLACPVWAQTPATFDAVATYSTGASSRPTGIAVGDVNGDGMPDIITANPTSNTISVLPGIPTYGFGTATTFSTGSNSNPTGIAVADVNGDGKLDVLTANFGTNTVSVLLGTGTGSFGAATVYSTGAGSFPYSLAVADVNGDGKPDLLTANYHTSTAGVLLGTGTGTFGVVAAYSTGAGSNPRSLVVADVNNDGKPDLLTANQGSHTAGVLLGSGTGSFGAAATYSTGTTRDSLSLAVADVNGDGKPDLLAANQNSKQAGVLLGTGSGTFGAIITFSTGVDSSPRSLAVADMNSDGLPDLLMANVMASTAGVMLGTGQGSFGPAITLSTGANGLPCAIVAADVNGDDQPDIITANQNTSTAGVLRNTTAIIGLIPLRTFAPVATYSIGLDSRPRAMAVADVNADGKLDIITANENWSTAAVQMGTGTGTFGAATSYSYSLNVLVDVAVADVNADGKLDIISTLYNYSFVSIQLGTGTGSFGVPTYYNTGPNSYPQGVVVADVNADGRPDILTANTYSQTVGVLLGTSAGTFGPATTYSSGAGDPIDLVVADVNGDGKLDVVTASMYGNTANVLLGTGTGTGSFGPASGYSTSVTNSFVGLAVADVTGDGKPDILTTNGATNKAIVLPGTGTGTFGTMLTYNTGAGSQPVGITVADMNGDGRPDLLTANSGTNTVGVLLGKATGGFGAVTTFSTSTNSIPYQIMAADVNGDGKKDLLTANYNTSTSGVLLNTGTVLATPASTASQPLVAVYPNPASGQPARLELSGLPAEVRQVQATLLDAVGRAVSTARLPVAAGTAQATIATTGLPSGVYLLRLSARDAQSAAVGVLPTQRLQVE